MIENCLECKKAILYFDKNHKLERIECKHTNYKISLKRYNKMRFCIYHEKRLEK